MLTDGHGTSRRCRGRNSRITGCRRFRFAWGSGVLPGCFRIQVDTRQSRGRRQTPRLHHCPLWERRHSPPNGHVIDPTPRQRSWGGFCRRVDRCRLARRRKERASSGLPVERLPIGEDSFGNQFGIDDAAGLLRVEVVGSEQVAPTLGRCVPVDQHGVVIAFNSSCQFTVGG